MARKAHEKHLRAFGAVVEHFGLYAASYGLALAQGGAYGPVQICVAGANDAAALKSLKLPPSSGSRQTRVWFATRAKGPRQIYLQR